LHQPTNISIFDWSKMQSHRSIYNRYINDEIIVTSFEHRYFRAHDESTLQLVHLFWLKVWRSQWSNSWRCFCPKILFKPVVCYKFHLVIEMVLICTDQRNELILNFHQKHLRTLQLLNFSYSVWS
jgi:hypothetical protein